MSNLRNYSHNILLRLMADADLALLAPGFTRVVLEPRQVLVTANMPIDQVYFLESGVASVVSRLPEQGMTEIGIFGREGFSGSAVMLGARSSPHYTHMQVDGQTALRIDSDRLLAAAAASPSLQAHLLRYVQSFLVQTAHTAVSNAHHRMEARLARWLLMCHDRLDGDEIQITHEFMAMMIAAQRSGVTITLHFLEGAGMIRSQRGRVVIVDRARLEDISGEAYGQPEAEYRRLIGPFGRSAGAGDSDS
ncbi:Crp/Fnr family transcriptional regulator [Polymorphobacter fuscus]|uniref:Helix-turn-helix domain-containing protein n=1 Tax=Sandarakinorhabdus fusca TaxID=1439888 RepID=A0A7C9KXU6_9SPHN|nr:Crp/Fnr family transcriptional regulator [Polymorphobacter fuscus]KAB7644918.1 Crp/Fnr family transcriptional regulator [Polymorphobacter fuscus]MQT18205.1 helix-turn-helix domain-containing protein [Polymorphobacter fuscus]NJC09525.1 CRP-like cAMP-binding protein [Polymorphobacter fuscus]